MTDFNEQIDGFSAEQRELLGLLLAEEGGQLDSPPLSYAQQRLWFLAQLEPDSSFYNLPGAVRLKGRLDVDALGRALEEIVRRHEVLRTSFPTVDGQPLQVISETAAVELPVVDLSGLSAAERGAETERLRLENTRAFDLARGPLLRAALLRLGADEHLLLLTLHHIVADGWSVGVLVRELSALYEAFVGGEASPLEELPVQYADYAGWQREWLEGEVLERQLSYWREHLAGAPAVIELPTDRPRPAVQSYRGATHSFTIPAALTSALKELSRREGATLFMTLLAAYQTLLARYSGQSDIVVGTPVAGRGQLETESLIGFFVNTLVLRGRLDAEMTFRELLEQVRGVTLSAYAHQDVPFEKLVEELAGSRALSHAPLFQVMLSLQNAPEAELRLGGLELALERTEATTARFDLTLDAAERGGALECSVEYSTDLFNAATVERMAGHFTRLLASVVERPEQRVSEIEFLGEEERRTLLFDWNDTRADYPRDETLHALFEQQAARTPDSIALVCEGQELTYAELNERANRLARRLRSLGVVTESLVGILMERSAEMVVGILAVLKAGGAYLPLDPAYPAERVAFMLEDSGASVLLTRNGEGAALASATAVVVEVDAAGEPTGEATNLEGGACASNLAYVIYTSGSTGRPKGVMVNHVNVVNFFTGMDRKLGAEPAGRWLSVTSIAFDISVLELLWTLTRGFEVVIQTQAEAQLPAAESWGEVADRRMDFSLFFFANYANAPGENKYRLLLESAKFADRHGFEAVWTPERHFHEFGGPYPNPAVTGAALAAVTERIQIRAGSVVLPLHNPIRVAEEWAVVDNISQGRVGVSFASGWHANDFVLAPANFAERHEVMYRDIETVRRLWRGEAVAVENGSGKEVEVRTLPRPIQQELPVWVTAAGSPETFRRAGAVGAGLLTHLLGQSLEELEEKIKVYRDAWREHGHSPTGGRVTLMLHTYVGRNLDAVREKVRRPLINYLMSSVSLVRNMMKGLGVDLDAEQFTDSDIEALLSQSFDRYFEASGLLGTPATCLRMVNRLKAVGVDEVACLVDFGVDTESVLAGLRHLEEVKERSNGRGEARDYSLPARIRERRVTHMQATPSMARMLLSDSAAVGALGSLDKLLLGGEELPASLARQVGEVLSGELLNMYGPTETTIWSAVERVGDVGEAVSIGRPIANTSIYILDPRLRPTPVGVPGELFIGGEGVVRGYLGRPGLSAERFVPDPFGGEPGARLYRTGDRARYLPDGRIEFLGRLDHQVKVRGYRIEPGEIESALRQSPGVAEAVVVARDDGQGDKRLVAYVVAAREESVASVASGESGESGAAAARTTERLAGELRDLLKSRLPEYMTPSAFVVLDALPLTPNGKIDRAALPEPEGLRPDLGVNYVAPQTDAEETVARVWREVLQIEKAGVHDNFFDLGGNSLLLVRVHAKLREAFRKDFPLIEMFRYPTISALGRHFDSAPDERATIQQAQTRAGRQAAAVNARRQQTMQARRQPAPRA